MSTGGMMARRGMSVLHVLGNTVPMVSGVLTAPFTARALGVEGRAIMVVVTTLSTGLLILGTFGLAWITRQELSRDLTAFRVWRSRALRVDAVSVLPSVAVGVGLAVALDVTMAEAVPLCLVVALSATSAVRAVWANALIASGRSWGYGLTNLLATAAVVVGTVATYGLDVLSLSVALWIAFVGLAVQTLGVGLLARGIEGARGFDRRPGPWLRTWGARVRTSVGGQLADFAVARSDLVVVGVVATRFELGLYSVPGLIPVVVYQLSVTVIQHSWSPGAASSDENRAAISWQASVVAGSLATVVGGLGVWLVFLPLFGSQFMGSQQYILPACAMALALTSVTPAVQHAATSPGRSYVALVALASAGVVGLAASVLGVGAAASVGLLAAALFAVGAVYTARTAGLCALMPRAGRLVSFVRG